MESKATRFGPGKTGVYRRDRAKSNMTRRYGRALRGVRLVDRVPHGHWVNMTYVCALRKNGITAPHSFEGAMNKSRFDDYVRNVLCPTLTPGDIVVWDN